MWLATRMADFLTKLYWLVLLHFVCDYVLQGDTMAREKNPQSKTELQKQVPWYYWMLAHALVHGGAVSVVMSSVLFGLMETFFHFSIDYLKCRKLINIHEDQVGHLACKLLMLFMWVLR